MQSKMIQGQITRLYYASEDFCAGVLETVTGQNIKFSIKFPVSLDERCKLKGSFKRHEKYGWQFEATGYEMDIPVDREGLIRFLSKSDSFKGIGRKRAEDMVNTCNSGNCNSLGDDFEELLIKTPEKLLKIKGITPKIVETLKKEWIETRDVNSAITVLAGYDLTMNQISKVIKKYGSAAVHVVRENPYSLTETIDGFGFRRADEIALKTGMPRDSKKRIQAGLVHIVKEQLNDGHTWIEERELLAETETVLQLIQLDADDIIHAHLDSLIHLKKLKCYSYHGTGVIALPQYFEMENKLFQWLKSDQKSIEKSLLNEIEKRTLNSGQQDAFIGAIENSQYLISGPAGSGKTFTINQLVDEFQKDDLSVTLCAPTGKAARKMEEVCDMPASTIHKLLGYDGRGFNYHGGNKLVTDILMVDECFDYKQPILTESGWQYLGTIVNNKKRIKVWSRNPETGNLELKPIVRWLKHEGPEKLLKIDASRSDSTRSMRIIKCTPEHKILTPYGYRKASELKEGQEIIVKGRKFSKEQRSVLIGSLMGDGCLSDSSTRTSPQVTFMQGDDQKDYILFKKQLFGNLAGNIREGKSGYTDKPVWNFSINVIDETYLIAKERILSGNHPSGRRRWIPTNKFLKWIDEQALSIWYLDNGSLSKYRLTNGNYSYYATIHSERFSKKDNNRIAKFLQDKFNLFPKVIPDSRGFFKLSFNKEETIKLMKIITPFVPECMGYKIVEDGKYQVKKIKMPDTTIGRVKSIEEVNPTSRYVFDIEVADYHNYVAGNIVVSNCSMIDIWLFYHLMDAIDTENTKIIFAGDHNQLPPVGAGNVLRDILQQKLIPYTVLTEVVRQAGTLKKNSLKILDGVVHGLKKTDSKSHDWKIITRYDNHDDLINGLYMLFRDVLPCEYDDLIRDVQVLSPMKKTDIGVFNLNRILQNLLQERVYGRDIAPGPKGSFPKLYPGDKVIQTKNDYKLGVINGHMGLVREADYYHKKFVIEFKNNGALEIKPKNLKNISLAYCLTVHKVQGSEFPCVISIVHSSHYIMLHQNLFYTSVSRAKNQSYILGDRRGVSAAAKNKQVDKRRTFLSLLGERQ